MYMREKSKILGKNKIKRCIRTVIMLILVSLGLTLAVLFCIMISLRLEPNTQSYADLNNLTILMFLVALSVSSSVYFFMSHFLKHMVIWMCSRLPENRINNCPNNQDSRND